MKKASLIFLICIYALATVGFSLKEFYCCGKLKSVSLTLAESPGYKCSKGVEKGGCCDSKYHFYKVKDNHFVSDQCHIPFKDFIELNLISPEPDQFLVAFSQLNMANRSNAPPLCHSVPGYIFNCVFRI